MRLLGHAGLREAFDEDLAVGEAAQVLAPHREILPGLLQQTEMAAAADQRVVVPDVFGERRDRTAQERQGLLEALRAQEGKAMNGGIEAGEAVERAEAQRLPGLGDRLVEAAGAQQRPAAGHVAEREAGIELERGAQLAQRAVVLARGAEAQP